MNRKKTVVRISPCDICGKPVIGNYSHTTKRWVLWCGCGCDNSFETLNNEMWRVKKEK